MVYSVEDLTLARGTVSIAEVVDGVAGEYVDLGNSPRFEVQLFEESREHRESRTPERHTDRRVVVAAGYELLFILDQRSVENLRIWLAGRLSGVSVVEPGKYLQRDYAIRFTSDNKAGPDYVYDFRRCRISPEQALSLIEGNAWARLWFRARGMPDTGAETPYFTVEQVLPYTYATWNPEGAGPGTTFTEDLLTVDFDARWRQRTALTTIGLSRSFYVEIEPLTIIATSEGIGLSMSGIPLYYPVEGSTDSYDGYCLGYFPGSLYIFLSGAISTLYTDVLGNYTFFNAYPSVTWTEGDVMGFCRAANGDLYVRHNGIWAAQDSGDVTDDFEEAVPVITGFTEELFAAAGTMNNPNSRLSARINCGQNPWAYEPPAGFEGVYI